MRIRIPLVSLALCLVLTACGSGSRDDNPAATGGAARATKPANQAGGEPPSPRVQTMTGTLQGNRVAIGAETTGWVLAGDNAAGGIDVDVSRVEDRAKQLDGQRVTVRGRMTERNWPERGKTYVLVAESIEPAEGKRPMAKPPMPNK